MDNRQVLLSLIRQNYKKISGIVNSESDTKKVKENEKLVNSAINYNFFADSRLDYVKDYRLLINDMSLFKFFVMQNDIINKMFKYKNLDFKYFLKDCRDLIDNYKYDMINRKYISGKFEYEKLVPERAVFNFDIKGAPRIKELTKSEYKSITDKEKVQVLYDLTTSLYLKGINEKVTFKDFVKDINYGEYNESVNDLLFAKETHKEQTASSDNKIEQERKKLNKYSENVIKNESGYYYGEESKQGYLFVEENDIEK